MRCPLLAAAGAAIAITLAVSLPAAAATPKLIGTVGPGFTIKVTLNGKRLNESSSVKAGKYQLVVNDKSSMHSFVLEQAKGGKFEKTVTSVGFVGKKTISVTLTPGKWEFYCQPHESVMHGVFTVP